MNRLFAIFALLVLAVSARGQTTLDALVNLDNTTPSTIGTQLTAAILNNGTVGSGINWSSSNGTQSAMTVGAHNPSCNLGTSVTAGGTAFSPAAQSQSFAISNGSNFSWWQGPMPSVTKVTVAACVTFNGVPYSSLMDKIRIDSLSGFDAVLQVQNGSTLEIEVGIGGGSIAHSGPITTVSNGLSLWCSLFVDSSAGTAKAQCNSPVAPYAQVGNTVTMTIAKQGNITNLLVGNAEVGTGSGTDTFENIVVDATTAAFPLAVGTLNTPWAGIVNPGRAIDWSHAGVNGIIGSGIPSSSWTQSGTTIAAYNGSAATINTAIASCGPNQYVLLGAGTFNLTSGIDFGDRPNCALRGAGADQTILVFTGGVACTVNPASICMHSTDINWKNGPTNLVNWTAGYGPGTNTITLASVTNLRVGNPLILDQCDSGLGTTSCTGTVADQGAVLVTDSSSTGSSSPPGLNGPYSLQGNGGGAARTSRQQEQIVQVISCGGVHIPGQLCSGTNVQVVVQPPLHMPNWASSSGTQAWWATSPALYEGVENLSIDSTGSNNGNTSAMGVGMFNCLNCWVSGVRSINTAEAHVRIEYGAEDTVRDSYFFLTQNKTIISYGVEVYGGSDILIENNIFHAVASPVIIETCSGCVVGYNFTINNFYTGNPAFSQTLYNQNSVGVHTAGNDSILYEGLYGNYINADVIHGTHNFQTAFRNRLTGTQADCYASGSTYATSTYGTCNADLQAAWIQSFSRMFNLVGNILGTTGTNTVYQNGTNVNSVLRIGGGNGSVPNDSNVSATMMLWGNCDSANGFGSCRFVNSEVPTSLGNNFQQFYANTVPASQTLPASFYQASKPTWWAAAKPFPATGPDVSSGNLAGSGGHANTIPAQDCYNNTMGGLADGSGPVLNFNANVCYYGGSPSSPVVSLSPTSIPFVNQALNTTSANQSVTLTNTGSVTLTITSITLTGTNAGDFAIFSNTCGASLGAGASCVVTVNFDPTMARSSSANLTFTTNAPTSPDNVVLSGTGVAIVNVQGNGTISGSGVVKP